MIELTDEQARALAVAPSGPPRVLNPRTRESFVLVRAEEYTRLTADPYDDSPWTREELEAAAAATAERAGWDAAVDVGAGAGAGAGTGGDGEPR